MSLNYREMLSLIRRITVGYGEDVFGNMLRTNAMMLDLAPEMTRERMLARVFIEIDGYRLVKNAGSEYPLVKRKLIQTLTDLYSLERTAAEWIVRVFGIAMEYEEADTVEDVLIVETAPDTDLIRNQNHINARLAIGKAHVTAAAAGGTVYAGGDNRHFQCDVSGWRDIIAVAAGDNHTVGLKTNGTVLATGDNTYDQCDIARLSGVVSVYAFGNDTVCVGLDGSAVAAGISVIDLSHFQGIQRIARFPEGVFGIREDGTVAVAVDERGDKTSEEVTWVYKLTGVKQIISTYTQGSVALKNDGRIYKMNHPGSYFAQWRDIVSIVDLSDSFAILREDGTVRVLSYNREQPRKTTEADNWRNITAICGKYKRLIGLTNDGNLKTACTDLDWQKRNGRLDFITQWQL